MINWKATAKHYRAQAADEYSIWAGLSTACGKLLKEREDLLRNLTSTQARCTELLLEVRSYKRQIDYLREAAGRYPILDVLLKNAKEEAEKK